MRSGQELLSLGTLGVPGHPALTDGPNFPGCPLVLPWVLPP